MRAAVVDQAGATPRAGDFPDPEPVEGEEVMDVLAAGIHPVVRALAAGTHYGSTPVYPMVPGVDGVGRGTDGTHRYVASIRAPWGTIAQRVAARPGLVTPSDADPAQIAATLNPGMSSWMPLVSRLNDVPELGCVVIVGATGVAGSIAVQSALALGASRVVGVGRDRDRLSRIGDLGAVPVPLDGGADALRSALGRSSPALVLDYAWGAAAETVWDALARQGMVDDDADILHVQLGTSSGARAALPGELLRSRRITVRGGGAGSTPVAEIFAQLPVFMERIASGEVAAPVREFSLSQIEQAWAYAGPERAVIVPD